MTPSPLTPTPPSLTADNRRLPDPEPAHRHLDTVALGLAASSASAPSPDCLVHVAVVRLILSLLGPSRATPPLFPAPNVRTPVSPLHPITTVRARGDPAAAARRGHPRRRTRLPPLAAVTRALPLVRSRSPQPVPRSPPPVPRSPHSVPATASRCCLIRRRVEPTPTAPCYWLSCVDSAPAAARCVRTCACTARGRTIVKHK
nr:predicted GPI-anchored protein 58 [Aegilops tauschii subsp. strangulata]